MRKIILTILLVIALAGFGVADWLGFDALLSSAVAVNATVTKTRAAADFTSGGVDVARSSTVAITITFARAAGAASTVDVEFECSYDGGTTWSILRQTAGTALFQIATNTTAQTGTTVRVTSLVNVDGISHLRVRSVYNSDGANNITAFQAYVSKGRS